MLIVVLVKKQPSRILGDSQAVFVHARPAVGRGPADWGCMNTKRMQVCITPDLHSLLRKDRVMNLLPYILEIQFIIKMSMP